MNTKPHLTPQCSKNCTCPKRWHEQNAEPFSEWLKRTNREIREAQAAERKPVANTRGQRRYSFAWLAGWDQRPIANRRKALIAAGISGIGHDLLAVYAGSNWNELPVQVREALLGVHGA